MERYVKTGKKDEFEITKHEFYTAVHVAKLYPSWVANRENLRNAAPPSQLTGMPGAPEKISDPTAERGEKAAQYTDKIVMVEQAAYAADPELAPWLLVGITTEKATYDYMCVHDLIFDGINLGIIPASKSTYCDRRRRCYYYLWQQIKKKIDGDNIANNGDWKEIAGRWWTK